jgi:hypothetical protein
MNGTVKKYVGRVPTRPASTPPASALPTSATLSTSRARPSCFSKAVLSPVSSSTVS